MIEVNAGNVILDQIWLWRADHDVSGLVYNSRNPSLNGIVINGDDVTAYGLFSEHHINDLVVWKGANGKVYMYQSEFPYDVD